MIQVSRGDPPEGFEAKSAALERDFLAARKRDQKLTASRFWLQVRQGIRPFTAELAKRFHFKCGYCESAMQHVSHPHVEHYRPKRNFPELMFKWSNWVNSCGICNDTKWADFPEDSGQPVLLDPVEDYPSAHISFRRSMIFGRTARGQKTIELVGLDRPWLERVRGAWLLKLSALVVLAKKTKKEAFRAEVRNYLIWAMQADAPFSAMARAFLYEVYPSVGNPDTPHSHVSVDFENFQKLVEEEIE